LFFFFFYIGTSFFDPFFSLGAFVFKKRRGRPQES